MTTVVKHIYGKDYLYEQHNHRNSSGKSFVTSKYIGPAWIQDLEVKKGALHQQLNIPTDQNIPITFLEKIKNAELGTIVDNPTKIGKDKIKVTRLLKQRVNLAINFKKME